MGRVETIFGKQITTGIETQNSTCTKAERTESEESTPTVVLYNASKVSSK